MNLIWMRRFRRAMYVVVIALAALLAATVSAQAATGLIVGVVTGMVLGYGEAAEEEIDRR
jgi:predicted Zn-dependent protease